MKNFRTGRALWRKFIRKKETLLDYKEGVVWLEEKGFRIDGIVCDGLRGMFQQFPSYKVQMCQFHQVQIVKRYLTKEPELAASKELLSIIRLLCHAQKESFIGVSSGWSDKLGGFLERVLNRPKNGQEKACP